jgi:formylglycine-generating enzyme required for sulfatase activity
MEARYRLKTYSILMKVPHLVSVVLLVFILASFNSAKKPSFKTAKKSLEGFCNYIPSGSTTILDKDVSIQAFYMSSGEITNLQYAEFLHDLKKKGEIKKWEIAKVDSTGWRMSLGSNETYTKYYFRHPAYHGYPVVNISKEGAELYCEWLTSKYDSLSNGELNVIFRLPTRTEWIYAANGGDENSKYAWGNGGLRNENGLIQANHVQLGSENIHYNKSEKRYEIKFNTVASAPNDGADVTAPTISYWPNPYGLYNMNGNVSEMVSDGHFAVGGDWSLPGYDVRNESIKAFNAAHPTVGFRIVASYMQSDK